MYQQCIEKVKNSCTAPFLKNKANLESIRHTVTDAAYPSMRS